MKNVELPIKVIRARTQMGVGETYMSALLKAMGIPGARMVKLSAVAKFLSKNPTFKSTDVYPRAGKTV